MLHTTMLQMQISGKWQELLAEIAELTAIHSPVVYVLGAVDSGKTTFSRFLVENLAKKFSTADIDCDPGQSRIGPPTTLGLRIYHPQQSPAEAPQLRFLGAISPHGYELPILAAVMRMVKRAQERAAQRIILDSCGFVLGAAAREFQFQVIDALRPDYVIAIQLAEELEGLLANFEKHRRIKIRRLAVSPAVKSRSMEERQEYRKNKYRDYFKDACIHKIALDNLSYHGRISRETGADVLHNLSIALCDIDNFTIVIGIIRETDALKRTLQVYAPDFDRAGVTAIAFGSIYLDACTYREL